MIKHFLSTVERSQNGTEDHKTEHLDHKMEHFYKKNYALLGFISPTKMRLMTKNQKLVGGQLGWVGRFHTAPAGGRGLTILAVQTGRKLGTEGGWG